MAKTNRLLLTAAVLGALAAAPASAGSKTGNAGASAATSPIILSLPGCKITTTSAFSFLAYGEFEIEIPEGVKPGQPLRVYYLSSDDTLKKAEFVGERPNREGYEIVLHGQDGTATRLQTIDHQEMGPCKTSAGVRRI